MMKTLALASTLLLSVGLARSFSEDILCFHNHDFLENVHSPISKGLIESDKSIVIIQN